MLKGVLPLVVLAVLHDGDAYGYEVLQKVRGAGVDEVGDASVYGTLQRLYDAGCLSSYVVKSDIGPSRKYYALTTAGSTAFKEASERWVRLGAAVDRLLDTAVA
jgi:PadR family transcriptional regulator PadR